MASSARAGLPAPVRWSLCLVAGVLVGTSVGFAVGLARPRRRPDPVARGAGTGPETRVRGNGEERA